MKLKRLILLGFFVALIFVVTPELVGEPHNEEEILSNQKEEYKNEVNTKFDVTELRAEKLSSVIDKVSFSDKVTIGDILLTHFNFKELREYQAIVSDGITSEEKDELLKVFVERVPKEDIDRILAIANKYTAVVATLSP